MSIICSIEQKYAEYSLSSRYSDVEMNDPEICILMHVSSTSIDTTPQSEVPHSARLASVYLRENTPYWAVLEMLFSPREYLNQTKKKLRIFCRPTVPTHKRQTLLLRRRLTCAEWKLIITVSESQRMWKAATATRLLTETIRSTVFCLGRRKKANGQVNSFGGW